MPSRESRKLTFVMSRKDALELGLLTCGKCGHPENNHFMHGDLQCAHCGKDKCPRFTEVARRGKLIKAR